MSIRDEEAPEFSHALRGYDRVQVDEYLAGFREYVIQVEDRAVAAETALVECRRELASPGSGGISERLAAILQLANEEADEIRARVKAEGEAMTQQPRARRNAPSARPMSSATPSRRRSTTCPRCASGCSSGSSSSVTTSAMRPRATRSTCRVGSRPRASK